MNKNQDPELKKLAKLGTEKLAGMLRDAGFQHRDVSLKARLAVAGAESVQELAKEVHKELSKYTNSSLRDKTYKSFTISHEIDNIRESIVEHILPKEPETAQELLERLIDRQENIFNNVDDSYGSLGDVFKQAVEDWGNAHAKTQNKIPEQLAALVYSRKMTNDFGIHDEIVTAFAPALGETGLSILEKMAREALAKLPPLNEETNPITDENRKTRFALSGILEDIADIKNDPDAYIEAVTIRGKPEVYGVHIAQRLISKQRYEEALQWLSTYQGPNDHKVPELKAACLETLGRTNDATEVLWNNFQQNASNGAYKKLLKLTPNNEIENFRTKIIATAVTHRDPYAALTFLTQQGFLDNAATLVQTRWKELDGKVYQLLLPVAEALEERQPLAAIILYRLLTEGNLEQAQSKYYRYGARYLQNADNISTRIKDWNNITQQKEYVQQLQEHHHRKTAFWKKYKRER